jgi:hypothetical protein
MNIDPVKQPAARYTPEETKVEHGTRLPRTINR